MNDIPIEYIASLANLQVIAACDNMSKGIMCGMSIGNLLTEHNKIKRILLNE